jgi:hypothetical protein
VGALEDASIDTFVGARTEGSIDALAEAFVDASTRLLGFGETRRVP